MKCLFTTVVSPHPRMKPFFYPLWKHDWGWYPPFDVRTGPAVTCKCTSHNFSQDDQPDLSISLWTVDQNRGLVEAMGSPPFSLLLIRQFPPYFASLLFIWCYIVSSTGNIVPFIIVKWWCYSPSRVVVGSAGSVSFASLRCFVSGRDLSKFEGWNEFTPRRYLRQGMGGDVLSLIDYVGSVS